MSPILRTVKKMVVNHVFSPSLGLSVIGSSATFESLPVWDTSCLAELIYDLVNMEFLFGMCPKAVKIQYLLMGCLHNGSNCLLFVLTTDLCEGLCQHSLH